MHRWCPGLFNRPGCNVGMVVVSGYKNNISCLHTLFTSDPTSFTFYRGKSFYYLFALFFFAYSMKMLIAKRHKKRPMLLTTPKKWRNVGIHTKVCEFYLIKYKTTGLLTYKSTILVNYHDFW